MADLSPGSEFAGHRIEGIAGSGGMGVVYRATHIALDLTVALKVIKPELAQDDSFRERFKRESRLAASIEHPNVLPVRHAGEEDGLLYITMRYVEGTDLAAMIARDGSLEAPVAVDLVAQVAAGLDAAHAKGLVHRDVKPANVLIEERDGSDRVFLTDFGLTRMSASSGTNLTKLTGRSQWVGTLDYVAPEQIEGKRVDGRADVYSLGCVLYEALSGRAPFFRDSEVATMYAHLNDPVPSINETVPDAPAGLQEVLRRSMAKHRDERYGSAGEMGQAAKAAVQGAPPPEPGRALGATAVAGRGQETAVSPKGRGEETAVAGAPDLSKLPPPTPPGQSPPPPPPGGARGAPPPPTPQPAGARSSRSWLKPVLIAGGAVLGLVVIAAVLAVAGVFGGGDSSSQQEGQVRSKLATFKTAFGNEDLSSIQTLLAGPGNGLSNATYDYPGYPKRPVRTEYRQLFNDQRISDYRVTVNSVHALSDSEAAAKGYDLESDMDYEYRNQGGDSLTGSVLMGWKDTADAGPVITQVHPRPDLYGKINVYRAAVGTKARFVATVGKNGPLISRFSQRLELGRYIPIKITPDPTSYSSFDSNVKPVLAVAGADKHGQTFSYTVPAAYPWAD